MRIAYFGHADMGAVCLQALLEAPHVKIGLVFTHPDLTEVRTGYKFQSVLSLAQNRGLTSHVIPGENTRDTLPLLAEAETELVVSVNWRGLFDAALLSLLPKGAINLHGSRLPKYRGNAPVTWAILDGESVTGATVHYIDPGMDTGDIIVQSQVPIEPYDTVDDVLKKLAATNGDLLVKAVSLIQTGEVEPIKQDERQASVGKRRHPQDGLIDWSQPAKRIYDWVRSMTYPLPGAFTLLDNSPLYVWKAGYAETGPVNSVPGTVLAHSWHVGCENPLVLVAAADGIVFMSYISSRPEYSNEIKEIVASGKLPKGTRFKFRATRREK